MSKKKQRKPQKALSPLAKYEDKLLSALMLLPEDVASSQFKQWCEYFYDRTNPLTYGNATKSALKVYDSKNYFTAGARGHENLKKLKNIRSQILDMEGFGFAELMKIGMAKVLSGNFSDWERMMERLDYFETPEQIKVTVNQQNNTQFNFNNIGEAIAAERQARGV